VVVALALLVAPRGRAEAEPSVWTRARAPDAERASAAAAEVEGLLASRRQAQRGRALTPGDPLEASRALADLYLEQAEALLEVADAARSSSPELRLLLGEVLSKKRECSRAVPVLEGVARGSTEAAYRLEAMRQLADCYGALARPEDVIRTYTEALRLEPHGETRSVLLANQAETYMFVGDLDAALAGYQTALRTLAAASPMGLGGLAPTTLWGLAVALDRSGDLGAAFEAIRLARRFDPRDSQLLGPNWSFVPEHDEAWYGALGRWVAARDGASPEARAEAYDSAVAAWEEYIVRAPADDRWLPIAKARLRACDEERRAEKKRGAAIRPR
jgi:tetratricopeptide (TPR) repeat protein